jgi:hypothetical protein
MAQLNRTKVDLLGVAVSLEGLGDTKNGLDGQFTVGRVVLEPCLHPTSLLVLVFAIRCCATNGRSLGHLRPGRGGSDAGLQLQTKLGSLSRSSQSSSGS